MGEATESHLTPQRHGYGGQESGGTCLSWQNPKTLPKDSTGHPHPKGRTTLRPETSQASAVAASVSVAAAAAAAVGSDWPTLT